jgi:hypothetical protein
MHAIARQVQRDTDGRFEVCRVCFKPFEIHSSKTGVLYCGCTPFSFDDASTEPDTLCIQSTQTINRNGGVRFLFNEFRVSMPSLFGRRTLTLQGFLQVRKILSIRIKIAVSQ